MRLLLSRGARLALQFERLGPAGPDPVQGQSTGSLAESFRNARALAEKLTSRLPAGTARVSAGDLHGLERLEQALREYLGRFLAERDPELLNRALTELDRRFGSHVINRLLGAFEDEFLPDRPRPAAGDAESLAARRQELLGELLVFSISHSNPAAADLGRLLHFGDLVGDTEYDPVLTALEGLLERIPGLDEDDESLIRGLRRPIEAAPDSIAGQLRWVSEHWNRLSPAVESGVVAALDLIAEETMPRFPPGPGPSEAPSFDHLEPADVHYGTDRSWMSSLVLTAKNTQVWLHQISRRTGREVTRLDQIPDAEFEDLAENGISGLWLIGLWERSRASRRIKQLCGNPEAAGSAYSLIAYRIASELGGNDALEALEEQAAQFEIRLSADMVPNHTGIDSEWMIERPELFLSTPDCPFPSYTFEGPDLSSDRRVGIFLEDHYYDRSDAAVVFKRVDRETGEVLYVYHGNDGTGMPWNDTAQLDYLNPATREAVTRTILEVAARFPIIRFDAAMTLAQRHIQRLWHPEPGSAGAIPSRAEHAMSESEFRAHMPREFWRDVVDRAETEAPGTLLLAEAFWLMEGYFVRNLGLHRVYNSAFMNMLRDHDNAGYRKLVRESLAFDPEIFRRYVNFLSNPDERTALEQFGDGDRYFGSCVLLATMPGLPMFAHGQIEGLRERYGMEYRRAYVDETPDSRLIQRHQRQIVPLLEDRERFAGVEGFRMHDFIGRRGAVDENVLAFSHSGGGSKRGGNQHSPDTSLVIFNNQPAATRGVLKLDRDFDVSAEATDLCRFRDRLTQRHFLRPAAAIHDHGLELELAAYESLVLVDFQAVQPSEIDDDFQRLSRSLGLRGTPSFAQALEGLHLEDARSAFGDVLGTLSAAASPTPPSMLAIEERLEELDRHLSRVLEPETAPKAPQTGGDDSTTASGSREPVDLAVWLEAISRMAAVELALEWPRTERMLGALELLLGSERDQDARVLLPAFALIGYVQQRWGREALTALEPGATARAVLEDHGLEPTRSARLASWVELAALDSWLASQPPPDPEEAIELFEHAAESETAPSILGYNRDKDGLDTGLFEQFLTWRATAAALSWLANPIGSRQDSADAIVGWCDVLERLHRAIEGADFRLGPVIARLRSSTSRLRARG